MRRVCAIYGLDGEFSHVLFDADLFDAGQVPVKGHPLDYTPLALVRLVPGEVRLIRSVEGHAYEIECNKGRFTAHQIIRAMLATLSRWVCGCWNSVRRKSTPQMAGCSTRCR